MIPDIGRNLLRGIHGFVTGQFENSDLDEWKFPCRMCTSFIFSNFYFNLRISETRALNVLENISWLKILIRFVLYGYIKETKIGTKTWNSRLLFPLENDIRNTESFVNEVIKRMILLLTKFSSPWYDLQMLKHTSLKYIKIFLLTTNS